jgi:4a-hydroxytetrahydrobiopterin dehydratase
MPEGELKVYNDEEIQARIQSDALDGWTLEDGWLRRKYNTDGWPTTLMLVNAVGYLCEAAWHHADLAVTWGKVWVKPGGPLEGTPNKFVQIKKST